MKQINGFQCEKCLKIHNNQIDAESCKIKHVIASDCVVTEVSDFEQEDLEGKYRKESSRIPKRIKVKFSDDRGDFGLYILNHCQ